ncbi:hypothetical protein [Halobaculum sp. EA56]|uniref:hypothetical protein n=1 Tax=Halobaculum sp. EA56 TaxID=3421648 RepID=UPI003EB912CB
MSDGDDSARNTGSDPRAYYDTDDGLLLGTYEETERQLTVPLGEPIRFAHAAMTAEDVLNTLLVLTGQLDSNAQGPFVVLDYDGLFVQTFARYSAQNDLEDERTFYYFDPPETVPALPVISRRGLSMERAVDTYHAANHFDKRGINPLSMWRGDDRLEDQQAKHLDWLADYLAAGRNPPEASLAELIAALQKQAAAENRIQDPTKITDYTADSDAHTLRSYLQETFPPSLDALRNIEHAPLNITDLGQRDYVIVNLSNLSETGQAVLGSIIGWRVYSDLLADSDATSASLIINNPPTIGPNNPFPNYELFNAPQIDELPLHLGVSFPMTKDARSRVVDSFNVRYLPDVRIDPEQHPDIEIGEDFPFVLQVPDGSPHPSFVERFEFTQIDNLQQFVAPADSEQPDSHVDDIFANARTNAQPYTVAGVTDSHLWSDRTRPAASDHTISEDGSLWLCRTCQEDYGNYYNALSCHDPAVLKQHRDSTTQMFFTLPAPVAARETPTGHQLSEAINQLVDLQNPTTENELLKLLELIRVGGRPTYLQETTRRLLSTLTTNSNIDADRLDDLINTTALSRRQYYSLTDTARDKLPVSLYIDDLAVYGSTLRHNAALRDTVAFLRQRDDVSYVIAPYFGRLPDNTVDAAAFNSDDELVCVADVLVDEDISNFEPLNTKTDHLYVLRNSTQARIFLNAHHQRNPTRATFNVTEPITGDYSISQLRNQFLTTNPNAPYPITTHRDIETRLTD